MGLNKKIKTEIIKAEPLTENKTQTVMKNIQTIQIMVQDAQRRRQK